MNIYNENDLKEAIKNKIKNINICKTIIITYKIILKDFTYIKGNNNYIIFKNANGISITGNFNKIENTVVSYCQDTGIIISKNGSYNRIINCVSYCNNSNKGNADGFACKLKSGRGNIFKKCFSILNEDDGFDLFAARHSVKFINCIANSNGKKGTGSGFKLGGFKRLEDLNKKIYHKLYKCISIGNGNYGFTSNNQTGKIYLKECMSFNNIKENFFFPSESHPKALNKEELKLGKTILIKCYSNDKNNLAGVIKND